MKLILTSNGFGAKYKHVSEKILSQININIKSAKVLLIPTAIKSVAPYDCYIRDLVEAGFSHENITVFDDENAQQFLNLPIDVIYVCGGHTFMLLRMIKACGFDKEIIKYVQNGAIYIGVSAGAMLATRNVENALPFYDEDDEHIKMENYNALSLLNGILFVHFDKNREKHYHQAVLDRKYNVYTLSEDDVLLADENKIAFL